MTQGNIYLDYNATTPLSPLVIEKVPEWLSLWGNPSSIHWHGRGPKKILRESRRELAEFFSCHPLELVFTSGGSEANNLALQGVLRALKKKESRRTKVILGGIEHPSIQKQVPVLQELGFEVCEVPVNKRGEYDLDQYKVLLDDQVAMVSVMLANNELGVLAPIKDMVEQAHQVGALFHSDMVQALGKMSFQLADLKVDLASFSSHKIHALKGAGLLYIRKGTSFEPMIYGGAQERYRRAGTENLLSIASFALMVSHLDSKQFIEQIMPRRDFMENQLMQQIPDFQLLCDRVDRLANTSCFIVHGVSAESLLMNLDIRGFSVGTGAACSSGNPEPSPVLLAIGLPRSEAQSSLRVSLGMTTTQEEIQSFVKNFAEVVAHIRSLEASGGPCVSN